MVWAMEPAEIGGMGLLGDKKRRDWLVAAAEGPVVPSRARKPAQVRYGLAPATLIATLSGPVPLEWLRPGDGILTRDHGYRPLLWIGQGKRTVGAGPQGVVAIEAGHFGPGQPDQCLRLAPDHGILLGDVAFLASHGTAEVLAPAAALGRSAPSRPLGGLYHLVLGGHELVLANGIWVESLPAEAAFRLFPRRAVALCEDLLDDFAHPLRPRIGAGELEPARPVRPTGRRVKRGPERRARPRAA